MSFSRAMRWVAASLLLWGGAAARLEGAQAAARDSTAVVDRILAVVGNKAILASNVQERLFQEFPQGKGLPTGAQELAQLRQDLLHVLVNEELMVQEAARDTTIKVQEDDVNKAVDVLIKAARARYASEEEYRRDLRVTGFETPDEYRSFLTEQQRRTLTIRELMGKLRSSNKLKPVAPTEAEIRAYFDKNRASFPKRPETVSFRQIAIAPVPKEAARARALAQADSIVAELRNGGDFAAAARRFSMDPSNREQGGELGWIRRGQNLDQHFEDAAFALRPGVISDPVESVYGFHLIQVQRAQPAEVQVRHILIMPAIDTTDADSARKVADAIHDALVRGASFDSIQRVRHDKSEEREIPAIPLDRLPPAYSQALEGVAIGGLTKVFRLDAPMDLLRSKYVVALVTGRTQAGEVPYDDVKEQIRSLLSDDLTQQRYLDRLRRATLVEFRTP